MKELDSIKKQKRKQNKKTSCFFESELALLVFVSFFNLGCILLRSKRRGDDSTATTTKNKKKLNTGCYLHVDSFCLTYLNLKL